MELSRLNRRDWFKSMTFGAAGLAGASLLSNEALRADFLRKPNMGLTNGDLFDGASARPTHLLNDGSILRPELALPKIHETDVLVVGGGPAGCVAAIAAARAGAKVTLVERYGHFGGLATGGLVLIILGHWVKDASGEKKQVLQGIGEEMMQRLEALPYGICNRGQGKNPTIDAEAYKYLLVEMITELNIDVFLHSWVCDAILDDDLDPNTGFPVVRGAVIQTKEGPLAIQAKQTIDTTGDGDLFMAAGCAYSRRKYTIGLVHRLGNLDRVKEPETAEQPEEGKKPKKRRRIGDLTPVPGVRWINMAGPIEDGIDVKTLSRLELDHRKQIWKRYQEIRNTPGYEEVFLMETAPQLGVRVTRVLEGEKTITLDGAQKGMKYDDWIAYGGAWSGEHAEWQMPFGAFVSKNVDNILTAGRSLSAEWQMSDVVRVIPDCWISGHAAGCAAAVAAKENVLVRNVSLDSVRDLLRQQNAYLG